MKQRGILIVGGGVLFLSGIVVGNLRPIPRQSHCEIPWRIGDEVQILMPTGESFEDTSTGTPVQIPAMRKRNFTVVAPLKA